MSRHPGRDVHPVTGPIALRSGAARTEFSHYFLPQLVAQVDGQQTWDEQQDPDHPPVQYQPGSDAHAVQHAVMNMWCGWETYAPQLMPVLADLPGVLQWALARPGPGVTLDRCEHELRRVPIQKAVAILNGAYDSDDGMGDARTVMSEPCALTPGVQEVCQAALCEFRAQAEHMASAHAQLMQAKAHEAAVIGAAAAKVQMERPGSCRPGSALLRIKKCSRQQRGAVLCETVGITTKCAAPQHVLAAGEALLRTAPSLQVRTFATDCALRVMAELHSGRRSHSDSWGMQVVRACKAAGLRSQTPVLQHVARVSPMALPLATPLPRNTHWIPVQHNCMEGSDPVILVSPILAEESVELELPSEKFDWGCDWLSYLSQTPAVSMPAEEAIVRRVFYYHAMRWPLVPYDWHWDDLCTDHRRVHSLEHLQAVKSTAASLWPEKHDNIMMWRNDMEVKENRRITCGEDEGNKSDDEFTLSSPRYLCVRDVLFFDWMLPPALAILLFTARMLRMGRVVDAAQKALQAAPTPDGEAAMAELVSALAHEDATPLFLYFGTLTSVPGLADPVLTAPAQHVRRHRRHASHCTELEAIESLSKLADPAEPGRLPTPYVLKMRALAIRARVVTALRMVARAMLGQPSSQARHLPMQGPQPLVQYLDCAPPARACGDPRNWLGLRAPGAVFQQTRQPASSAGQKRAAEPSSVFKFLCYTNENQLAFGFNPWSKQFGDGPLRRDEAWWDRLTKFDPTFAGAALPRPTGRTTGPKARVSDVHERIRAAAVVVLRLAELSMTDGLAARPLATPPHTLPLPAGAVLSMQGAASAWQASLPARMRGEECLQIAADVLGLPTGALTADVVASLTSAVAPAPPVRAHRLNGYSSSRYSLYVPGVTSYKSKDEEEVFWRKQQPMLAGRSPVAGWGAFSPLRLRFGQLLGTYLGAITMSDESERRGMRTSMTGTTYLFKINPCGIVKRMVALIDKQPPKKRAEYMRDRPPCTVDFVEDAATTMATTSDLDAMTAGNVTRFMNSGTDGEAGVNVDRSQRQVEGNFTLLFHAKHDKIQPHDELFFHYGFDVTVET